MTRIGIERIDAMQERNRIARSIVNLLHKEKVTVSEVDNVLQEVNSVITASIDEMIEKEQRKIVRPVDVE